MPVLDLTFASGESSLSVRRFSVHEALSSLFTVSVWARASDPSLDLGALLGHPASFRIASGMAHAALGGGRLWRGMVSFIEQVQAEVSDKSLSTYYLRLVPSLWMLTQRRNHRVFQHISIPDITDALLDEWGIEHVWKIDRGRYAKLEYRVQYGESDYAFLSRLFEEAGIAFSFPDDEQEGSTLTLGDKLHLKPSRPVSPLRYVDNPGGAAEKEYVTHVRLAQEVRPGAHTIRDDDFRNPAYPLFGEAPRAKAPEDRYEQYHYQPGAFLVETDNGGDTPAADDRGIARHDQRSGKDRAERALLGERMSRQGVSFDTNVIDLRPGTVFTIDKHPHPELDAGKKLLVTEFSLEGSPGGEWRMAGHAVFADVPYQPPLRTSKPHVLSVQSATVVGPSGQEIHTDEFGRIRVRFPWDREGKLDEKSSCWIRVNQGWGGAGYGMLALPRLGQEVLIGFLEGNPDQPILVGRVFNQTNPVPYKLPESKTISTWKSNSSQGSDGFNELKFEDKKADELVYIQAEKNLRQLVKHDETITVLNNREKHVTLNDTDTTGVNRIEVTGANRTDTTGANHLTVLGSTRTKLTKKHESERTEGSQTLRAAKILDVVVKKQKRDRVDGDVHLHVKGERREKIDHKQSLTVGEEQQEHVDGSYALATGLQIHLVAGEEMVGEAQDVTLKGPGGFIRIDAGGVTIKGTLVEINTGGGKAGQGRGSKPALPEEPEDVNEVEGADDLREEEHLKKQGAGRPVTIGAVTLAVPGASAIVKSNAYKNCPAAVKDQIKSKKFTKQEKQEIGEVIAKYKPLMKCKDQPLKKIERTDKAITVSNGNCAVEETTMGEWFSDKGTLVLTDAASTGTDFIDPTKQFRGTAAHEISHALMNRFDPRSCKKYKNSLKNPLMLEYMKAVGWDPTGGVLTETAADKAPTEYGKTNPNEDLAEASMLYLYEPETLKSQSPVRHEFLRKLFGDK